MGQVANVADSRSVWIHQGRVVEEPRSFDAGGNSEDVAIHRDGFVRVTYALDSGTTIRWAAFSPNWSSLYYIMECLSLYPAPYHLKYYLAGWFSETIATSEAARDRLHALIAKSDVHLLARTFVKPADPDPQVMPPLRQDAWSDRAVKPDYSIDCVRDDYDDRFKVMRIGPGSPIARLWGIFPVSYPCLIGNPYDQIVSEVYPQVVKSGEPHYSHVYAAMSLPNRQVHWVPYQRVVLPHRFPDGRDGVTVVSELSPVDIQVV
jgi:hypothetical protein